MVEKTNNNDNEIFRDVRVTRLETYLYILPPQLTSDNSLSILVPFMDQVIHIEVNLDYCKDLFYYYPEKKDVFLYSEKEFQKRISFSRSCSKSKILFQLLDDFGFSTAQTKKITQKFFCLILEYFFYHQHQQLVDLLDYEVKNRIGTVLKSSSLKNSSLLDLPSLASDERISEACVHVSAEKLFCSLEQKQSKSVNTVYKITVFIQEQYLLGQEQYILGYDDHDHNYSGTVKFSIRPEDMSRIQKFLTSCSLGICKREDFSLLFTSPIFQTFDLKQSQKLFQRILLAL